MRVKLTLTQTKRQTSIPINYNYHLTSLIYDVLSRSSKYYSEFLHDRGYRYNDSKKFKLFTYSQLRFPEIKVRKDQIISNSREVFFHISSPVNEFVEHLANGLLQEGEINIARSKFRTTTVEILEQPKFSKERAIKFICLSPLVSSTMKEKDGELRTYYYRHDDPELADNLQDNLAKKYQLVHGNELDGGDLDFEIDFDRDYIKKKNGKITKLVDFKGTKIKGIFAPFEVKAPRELIEIGYEAGFGGKGSMGFGMVEVVK